MAWLVRDDYQKWLIRVQGQEPKVFYRAFVNSRLVIVHVVLGDSTSPVCALIRSLKDSCARFLPEIVNLDHLSDTDKALVGEALRAVVHGPFFPEWEFHTLFGLMRNEIREVADAWPDVDLTSESVTLAVNNSLNNLLGYPHRQDSVWSQWISIDRLQLNELLSRLRGSACESYFRRLM